MNAAGTPEDFQQAKTGCLSDTPGRHEFTPNPIDMAQVAF
jgi:hypothetical protein